jgi:hypothetical protein
MLLHEPHLTAHRGNSAALVYRNTFSLHIPACDMATSSNTGVGGADFTREDMDALILAGANDYPAGELSRMYPGQYTGDAPKVPRAVAEKAPVVTVADMIVQNRQASQTSVIKLEWRANRWLGRGLITHAFEGRQTQFFAEGNHATHLRDYEVRIPFTLPLDRLHYDSLLFVRNDEFGGSSILYLHDDERPEFRVGRSLVNIGRIEFTQSSFWPDRDIGSDFYTPTIRGIPTATYTVYMYNRQGDGAAPRKIGNLTFNPHADPPTVMAEASPEELTRSRAHAFAHIASSDRRHDTDNYEHELQKTSEEGYRRMQKETFSGASTDKCCFTNLT